MRKSSALMDFLSSLYIQQQLPANSSEVFFEECLDCILKEDLGCQVYSRLQAYGLLEDVPSFFKNEIHKRQLNALQQNMYVKHHLRKICEFLDDACIDGILLKGIDLAENFFGGLGMRPTSDIDLLLHEEDVAHAVAVLKGLGYLPPEAQNPLHFHSELRYENSSSLQPLSFELHWSLTKQRSSNLDLAPFWNQATAKPPYLRMRSLSLQHTFYGLCLHAANHRMDAMKHTVDLLHMLTLFGEEIDYQKLFKESKSDKTFRRVYAVLAHLYWLFPELQEVKSLPANRQTAKIPRFCVGEEQIWLLDSWRHRLRILKDIVWPPVNVALWHLRDDTKANYRNVYFLLYRKRIKKLIHQAHKSVQRRDGFA